MLQKPEAPSVGVIKGSQYLEYGFTLDALTLNTSGICNIRGTLKVADALRTPDPALPRIRSIAEYGFTLGALP